ncbi:tellurite resistance TerB family protein [Thauera sp.]|uniref:tellurite resistance TerB family protein n=1 Tax=Thauera sp. TaxID=1905334 RepID=UPI0039E23FD6
MSFGNIIGQILQQGMASQSRSRLDHTLGSSGLGGAGGLGDLLGTVLGAGGGGRGAAGGGLADVLGSVLGGGQGAARGTGGMGGLGDLLGGVLGGAAGGRGGAGGGLGDLLGGMLSGGSGGASRAGSGNPLGGTGMAILATLAMAALKNWQQSSRASAAGFTAEVATPQAEAAMVATMTSPETEQLVLRAMISAAKADGEVDESEIQRIVGKISEDGVTAAEKQFVVNELHRPLDLEALIAAVPNQAVAAQIYGASLLAIDIDTEAEVAYLRQLARGLGLDGETVARLHQLTGVQA